MLKINDHKETQETEEDFKEQGYKIATRANQCVAGVNKILKKIEDQESVLEVEYDELINKQKSKLPINTEALLWRQIDLEREKVRAYEQGYIQEKLLRMKAVAELRKHERLMFGEVREIAERMYGSEQPKNIRRK